ncbi:hypothetical protein H2198_010759 [Neophaeococcomyces mojaviensis]|uniref:Uncharacterized protein n=1 Tax=Neophaeococcomyces mojaviensis TaxID=3383035 RepID=A0ACC2ZQP9_9EURO|nr:hypothetical protein H2198_010759 [Knufia sp. JES_112]
MSESGGGQSKTDKKKEYNRNAQRVFRQRRKEHLSKLEAAQSEANTLQAEELERLRFQNLALTQENESLRTAYSSSASSPATSTNSGDVKGSPSKHLPHGHPSAFLAAATATSTLISSPDAALIATVPDPSCLVVLVPNNIREIRRSLHQLFSPIMDISVMSDPQTHLTALANLAPGLPYPLKPTQLQLTTPHHVYIDLVPSPTLRDRLIVIGPANCNTFFMEACTIACEIEDYGQMTIWGEDWLNEFSWEFSAAVLERWGGWLLTDEWGQRANFWRRQRGHPTLPGYD